jgi:cytochrome P450
MTTAEITATGTALILAGSETTAGALCATTFLLLSNPDKMRRVQDEVDSAFESKTEITLKSTLGVKYLLAVIEESLRVYPPAPVRLGAQNLTALRSSMDMFLVGYVSALVFYIPFVY